MVILSLYMVADAGGFGLPQMSDAEMLERMLSGDSDRSDKEPEIASSIGEQMLLMGLRTMPRSLRVRIRDITSRVPLGNAILVGGGIGHLSAWLFDLWCAEPTDEKQSIDLKPDSFIIVEEGARFGVIIDRLIRRYNAESWSRVIAKPWSEITAEVTSWSAAAASLPSSARPSDIPLPVSLIIVDLPDSERPEAASSAFDILSPDGLLIVPEPEVPTGDVGFPEEGKEPTEAQTKVIAFNKWISFIKRVSENHSVSFVELSGGTLAVIRRIA